jgi:hypothetical protein
MTPAKSNQLVHPRFFHAAPPVSFFRSRAPAFATERLGRLVLTRIAYVLLDLAGQDLGAADRVGDGVGGSLLTLWSLRHTGFLIALR